MQSKLAKDTAEHTKDRSRRLSSDYLRKKWRDLSNNQLDRYDMNGDGISQREYRGSSLDKGIGDGATTASATSLAGMNLISRR